MTLKNKVVVITGASAGIGKTIAQFCAAEKATLVLAARSEDKLQQLAATFSESGCRVLVVPTDVSVAEDLRQLTEATIQEFGCIDVLINNAGIECFNYFERLTANEITQTIQTNLTATILLTRLAIPHMLEQGSGAIINMASTAGKHCPAYETVYGATKAGLIGLTQGLRAEYHDKGISISAICPGFTRSGGIYDRMVQASGRKASAALGSTTADNVAAAVLKAIQGGHPELIVNRPPVRPAIIFREFFPRLGEKVINTVTKKFIKRAVDAQIEAAKSTEQNDASNSAA